MPTGSWGGLGRGVLCTRLMVQTAQTAGRAGASLDILPALAKTAPLMADPKVNEQMEKIVSLCKRRGFIFQSSEIYGGINGFWDYGPLGAELKRNVKDFWWRTTVHTRDDVAGLEATIIMHPQIWKASGHVDTFVDPMSTCHGCKRLIRTDQAWEMIETSGWGAPLKELYQSHAPADELAKWAETKGKRLVPRLALILNPRAVAANWERRLQESSNAERPTLRQFFVAMGREEYEPGYSIPPCPHCGSELTEPRPFNLMFRTCVGPAADDDNVAFLRPETAQAIFVQFKNVLETSRQKVPFGIAQAGKAFRNEVTPRNFTFRSREFEQMELEYFIRPDEAIEAITGQVTKPAAGHPGEPRPCWGWQTWHQYWVEERIRFYESIGLPRATLEEYWQTPEELAHYARATVDLLFKFPFGTQELEGIAARSDFDLSQHQRFSGKTMGVFDEELKLAWAKLDEAKKAELSKRYFEARLKYLVKMGEAKEKAEKLATEDAAGLAKGNYIPHVIEPSAGVDRLILALICNAYTEDQAPDEKGKLETRVVMKFHPRIAPIKVAVFPLLKNRPELVKKAHEVRDLLRPHMTVFYDDAGAIGRRYRRQDEAGTPFGVTVDFDTLGEKPDLLNTVTLRDRDTMQQTRVKIGDLLSLLLEKIR